jgi:hypothetical protein
LLARYDTSPEKLWWEADFGVTATGFRAGRKKETPMSQEIEPRAAWYPDPYGQPVLRWYDGAAWTAQTVDRQPSSPPAAAPIAIAVAGGGRSGIGGWHVVHFILTIATLGLWLPVWIIHAIVGSRRGGNSVIVNR